MNETMVTVVGNVATAPVFRELPSGSVARFRLAATARHRDRATGAWADGHTNFFTVWAWRGLGTNVAASLSVGEPVIVQGRLKVRNEERGGGQQWMSADIDAVVVGHDLSRGTGAFRRAPRSERVPGAQQPSPVEQQPASAQKDGPHSAAETARLVEYENGSRKQDEPLVRNGQGVNDEHPTEAENPPAEITEDTGMNISSSDPWLTRDAQDPVTPLSVT